MMRVTLLGAAAPASSSLRTICSACGEFSVWTWTDTRNNTRMAPYYRRSSKLMKGAKAVFLHWTQTMRSRKFLKSTGGAP